MQVQLRATPDLTEPLGLFLVPPNIATPRIGNAHAVGLQRTLANPITSEQLHLETFTKGSLFGGQLSAGISNVSRDASVVAGGVQWGEEYGALEAKAAFIGLKSRQSFALSG